MKKAYFKITGFLLLAILLTSCKAILNKSMNPYYSGMTVFESGKLKKKKNVDLYDYNERNLSYFLERGYKIKAKSAFRDKYVHPTWAELACQQLGTSIMLIRENYVGSISGRKALSFRIPGEKYHVTSTTQTSSGRSYVTTTTIQKPDQYRYTSVPYTDHYYDYYAVFLVKDNEIKSPRKGKK